MNQDNSYSNTILIDCNRLHSEQAKGSNDENPALFTNKVGHGIQVKAGDTMSVYSSFISEIGAGAGAIEFKGEDFGTTREITYTNVLDLHPINACNDKPMGFERCTASNITENIPVKDNEATILINYYKTANGEGHVHLPRRFFNSDIFGYEYNVWTSEDSVGHGRPFTYQFNPKNNTYPYVSPVMTIQTYGVATPQKFFVEEDFHYYPATLPQYTFIKKRTDGSKYKVFIAEDTRYGMQSNGDNTLKSGISPAEWDYHELIDKIDIKLDKGFSSPSSIAESITNQLQKSEEPKTLFYYQNLLETNVFSASNIPRPISVIQESKTYKPFYSCNFYNNTETGWTYWAESTTNNASLKSALEWESSYKYIAHKRPDLWIKGKKLSKQIGNNFFKYYLPSLPDIDNLDFGQYGFGFLWDITEANVGYETSTNASANIIPTTLEWTTPNLEALRDFFKEQKNHPELFLNQTNHYRDATTIDNSRFIHLNNHSASFTGGMTFKHSYYLGNDMIYTSTTHASDGGFLTGFCSKPLFFDFNPKYEDTLTDGRSWESGYAYGFGKKVSHNGSEYIAFTTDKGLGWTISGEKTIAEDYYKVNESSSGVSTKIAKNTLAGFDCHFSAYGTCAIQISDGTVLQDFNNIGTRKVYNLTTATHFGNGSANASTEVIKYGGYSYLGADQPKLVFNTTTNKFEITDLHTAERIQNEADAGGVKEDGTKVVEVSATAGDKVYKLNKRLLNTNWTPDMISYQANQMSASANDSTGTSVTYNLSLLNPNITPFSIMDSMSGIIIKDFGYDKKYWDNGIWGILGFTYEQFNSTLSSSNDLTTRVNETNKNQLAFAFTNADINAGDSINYTANIFGAKMYGNQIPYPELFVGNTTMDGGANPSLPPRRYLQVYPAISNIAESISLSAPNLPRKMLRPYYCIRSDITDDSFYIGSKDSGQPLPVVAVVNKINGDGDFFFQENEGVQHTFTKDKVITNITTSIHDPDQSFSKVNNDSAVIYKITKNIPASFDIISQIQQKK